eukprot:1316506-Pleurochrysis_carterae.AAC.1
MPGCTSTMDHARELRRVVYSQICGALPATAAEMTFEYLVICEAIWQAPGASEVRVAARDTGYAFSKCP